MKTYQIVHFKYVEFTIYKLYFNEAVKEKIRYDHLSVSQIVSLMVLTFAVDYQTREALSTPFEPATLQCLDNS